MKKFVVHVLGYAKYKPAVYAFGCLSYGMFMLSRLHYIEVKISVYNLSKNKYIKMTIDRKQNSHKYKILKLFIKFEKNRKI